MTIVGYGTTAPPPGGPADTSNYDGLRRHGTSSVDQVIDENWVTFNRDPVTVCFGDSGAPTFFKGRVVAIASDGAADCASADYEPESTAGTCASGSSGRSTSGFHSDVARYGVRLGARHEEECPVRNRAIVHQEQVTKRVSINRVELRMVDQGVREVSAMTQNEPGPGQIFPVDGNAWIRTWHERERLTRRLREALD